MTNAVTINSALKTRQLVLQTLLPLEKGRQYRLHVDDSLNQQYSSQQLTAEEKRFTTFLAYGVLRHWFQLTALVQQFSAIPMAKLEPRVRLLLKMGLFQLSAMDSVPDYAAVASTLELASALGLSKKSRGFINAILQTFIRQGKPLPQDNGSVLPAWWLERLASQFSPEDVEQIIQAQEQIPLFAIRVNTLKTTVETYRQQLEAQGIAYEASSDVPDVLFLGVSQGNPQQLPGYTEGLFLVQDESSAQVAYFLNPQPGETVLEIGAAPGTKTTHLAALMQNQGRIIAVDNSAKRMTKLAENCQRLGVTLVEPLVSEGQSLPDGGWTFDKALVDAPCSGTGTIRKHPEILLVLKKQDFASCTQTQTALLTQAFQSLKPGGVLVYSTCSLEQVENQEIVQQFLTQFPDQAQMAEERLILPSPKRDGFYMAKILKLA